jgi:coenzyme F420-reducing hydrogenase alpha subunit
MSKKDKNAKRPSYLNYRGTPKGFKMYIHDMIVALRNEGNKHAKKFDLDGFMNIAPDEITPDSVADHPEMEPFIHELMEHLAWDIFGDMLQKVGLTQEVIDRIKHL